MASNSLISTVIYIYLTDVSISFLNMLLYASLYIICCLIFLKIIHTGEACDKLDGQRETYTERFVLANNWNRYMRFMDRSRSLIVCTRLIHLMAHFQRGIK